MVYCGLWWFVMVHDVLWWFVMIHDGLWWFVMICDGLWWFFSKILKKISCDPLFNQSESKILYQISFWMRLCDGLWWFVVVCHVLWWFVVVCDDSWWFFSKIIKKISCDPLFNQSESKIQYQVSFWMRPSDGLWWFVMVCDGSWWFMVIHCSLWWFMVVCDGLLWFSTKLWRKGHVTLYSTNQSPKFMINSHFGWDFVIVCDDLFVMVCDDLWWSVKFFFSRESNVTLFSTNQIHYEISFLVRFCICPFPFKEHASKELC